MSLDFTSSQMGPWSAENVKVFLLYPEAVIPTELHSEKENEFEGLSMTLILPNTTVLGNTDRQTQSKSTIYLPKEKLNQQSFLASVCSHLTIAFPGCRLPLFSLVILWDPSLPSWIPIIVQLYGCPCSATHASGTVNTTPASCLQSRGD